MGKRIFHFVTGLALFAVILAAGSTVVPITHAQIATADFRIIDVSEHQGQLLVQVEHFKADGTFDYFENYLWQGREGSKFPRATNGAGIPLMDNGTPAPYRIDSTGRKRFTLPANRTWQMSTKPFLNLDSITSAIQEIHDQRRDWVNADWPGGKKRGQSRLSEKDVTASIDDHSGIDNLTRELEKYSDTGYKKDLAGKPTRFTGIMPEVHRGKGELEYGTVSIFYPSLDGSITESTNAVWATIRGAAGDSANTSNWNTETKVATSTSTNVWAQFLRSAILFDTSTLTAGVVVTDATMGIVVMGKSDGFSEAGSMSMVDSTPASNSALVAADYTQILGTKQATDITISGIVADSSTYNNWTLNATGLGNINKTGITKFGIRSTFDVDNSEPTWVSDKQSNIQWFTRNETDPAEYRPKLTVTHVSPTAAITGTIGDGATEQEVRDGGGTILVTMTDDTWVAAGATFDAQRQAIIDGLDAASSPATGWNNEVRDSIGVASVVRTSSTLVTITLSASEVAGYSVTSNEIITVTVPATALTAGGAITATPTITITAATEAAAITGTIADGAVSPEIQAGGQTAIVTLTNTKWVADGATFDAQRQNIIDGFVSASSETNGWNNRRSDFAVTDVVRTSDTIATVTFSASSAYAISAAETITLTVPASAMVGPVLTATPTFAITPNYVSSGTWISPAIDLSSIIDTAYCAVGWSESIPAGTSAAVEYSSDGGGSYSTATNGSCPFTIGSSLAAVSDFRIKVTLTTTDTTATPTITALGFIAGTTAGQTVRYQLNTTPALTATDRTGNGYSGTMSFPALPSGVSTTVGSMTALRAPPSAQTARGIPQVTSPVTGTAVSDNLFNTDETGWTGLPGYQLVNTMATAGDGLPVQFIWYIMLGLVTIMLGFFALNLTQSLFAGGVAMALGLGASIAMGGGLIPGWVIFVFIPVAIGMIFLRPRLAI